MGLTRITAQQISNIDYKQAVRVVTLTNITLAGSAPSTVDGITLVANDRVLVTGQTTGSQNGLYYVSTLGTGSNGTWTRSTDGDNTGEILAGLIVMVTEGTTYADTQWKLTTDDPITIGTTALTFVQNYLANSISSGTSNVSVRAGANVTISSASTANVLTISSTGTVVSGTESVTGNITGGNILTGGLISATGNITGGNISATAHTGTTVSITGTATAASVVGGVITGTSTSVTGTTTAASVVGGVITGTSISVTGATTAASVVGGVITGSSTSVTGTTTAASVVGGIITGSSVSVSGNVTGGNVLAGTGIISASGNVTGGNLLFGAGIVSGTGNVSGNVGTFTTHAGTTVSVTGTVTAASVVGGVITGSSTSVTGTTTAASVVGGVMTGSSLSVTGNITGGNVLGGANVNATTHTGATVSVTGNITGGNLISSGIATIANNLIVTSPSPQAEGGQLILAWANISGITGQSASTWNIDVDSSTVLRMFYQNAASATAVLLQASPTSNVVSFPNAAGVSATGNVTATYFFGNGSQLTGITGGGGGSSITNGTSNVSVALNGNVTVGVAGTAAVTTFATTGIFVPGLASVTGNVNIGNAAGVTYANAGGVRAWTYYNNATTSIDTVFL